MSTSEWEIRKLDQQYGRVEDIRRERNAAMLNRLWTEGEKLITHQGTTIQDLDRLVERVMSPIPVDGAICTICKHSYEEHAAHGEWCPNIWSEDSDWSSTKRFTEK